jgi:hypothetical protein
VLDPEMRDWALVLTNGCLFAGRLEGDLLSPVYELMRKEALYQAGPGALVEVLPNGHSANAPLGYFSLHRLTVPKGALVVPITDLSLAEQNDLRRGIESFEIKLMRHQAQAGALIVASTADELNKAAAAHRNGS